MKKLIFLCLTTLIFIFSTVYAADISVTIDGRESDMETSPIVDGGRVLMPIRSTFESLGATVEWNSDTNTAVAKKGTDTVEVELESKDITVNGEKRQMDIPPVAIDGRIYIPVRFAAESFGCSVAWNGAKSTVVISTHGYEFYKESSFSVPLYEDVVKNAHLLDTNIPSAKDSRYVYSTDNDSFTEYVMQLQRVTGYESYAYAYNDDFTVTYAYTDPKNEYVLYITCGEVSPHGFVAAFDFESDCTEEVPKEEPKAQPVPQNPEQPSYDNGDVTYYENTDSAIPTFESITGAYLTEKDNTEDYIIYKYQADFMSESVYSMILTSRYGFSLYSTDMDFTAIKKYYSDGERVVGIYTSLFGSEVWIILPR